ncbi:response regulator transcription factor [Massilia forsythiae]|uniref:Response regulator transcription factor n=1 Tax=Massilia forsythiae TaxID=2728020 RepID=A0A7Z2W166_9BURK|nr:LuxR C-terminal-related transcriptional regulator [Massilia forsythiae]QJE02834.1 response regulator transcription factor [Massilia forsythiae]
MDSYSSLLLNIYQAARNLTPDEFNVAIMAMLRTKLDFDAARLLGADISNGEVVVQSSIMYNIPTNNALDWESIQRRDLVLPYALANLGIPVSFHCPTLFAERQHAIMRDYVQRYEHRNGLVMVLASPENPLVDGLSLYRADADAHFGAREQHLMVDLMPHVQEALKLNRQLAVATMPADERNVLLIAQLDGLIHYSTPEGRHLMLSEWPDWRPACLPVFLLEDLRRLGSTEYRGQRIVIRCQRRNALLFLHVTAHSPRTRLSPRELQVARLYGRGLAAKAVAKELSISQATARNTLQKIYQKLNVHDKAELAQLLVQHGI